MTLCLYGTLWIVIFLLSFRVLVAIQIVTVLYFDRLEILAEHLTIKQLYKIPLFFEEC